MNDVPAHVLFDLEMVVDQLTDEQLVAARENGELPEAQGELAVLDRTLIMKEAEQTIRFRRAFRARKEALQ